MNTPGVFYDFIPPQVAEPVNPQDTEDETPDDDE